MCEVICCAFQTSCIAWVGLFLRWCAHLATMGYYNNNYYYDDDDSRCDANLMHTSWRIPDLISLSPAIQPSVSRLACQWDLCSSVSCCSFASSRARSAHLRTTLMRIRKSFERVCHATPLDWFFASTTTQLDTLLQKQRKCTLRLIPLCKLPHMPECHRSSTWFLL